MTATTEERSWESMVLVGRIARAHGRWGQVIVNPETDFPVRRFRSGNVLYTSVDGKIVELRVTEARFQGGRPVLGFDRVASIDDAERLAGVELRVPESNLKPLPADVFYEHELVGCEVTTVDGKSVGMVTEVQGTAGANRLIIGGGDGEVDVPLADSICVRIDTTGRTIVVDPPEGLLDLNRHA